jgi:TolB-like protein
MGKSGFLRELRRRHVVRVAVAYAVAGWLLIQVSATVVPALHLPDAITTAIVLFVFVGFPIALVLAWAFDATPRGIVRTDDTANGSAVVRGSRRAGIAVGLIGVLMAAIAGGGYWWWHRPSTASLADVGSTKPSPAATDSPSASMPIRTPVAIPAKSVAVLPFDNLSADQDNAYFASGMQDMILTRLADIADLKVISRTSTAKYASHPIDLKTIAQQLGVATILEGSVQRAGNQVLINVQLVDANTDAHLWAEAYTRGLDNIFDVEGEVAQKVADALKAKLTSAEQQAVAARPTSNPAAYDAYLRGVAVEVRPELSADKFFACVRYFSQAVELDPGFMLAWAHLSHAHAGLYFVYYDHAPARLAQARQAAETALKLGPDRGEAWIAEGYYRYWGLRDYDAALKAFEVARSHMPNNAEVLAAIGYVERRQGRWQASLDHQQQAIELDPRNASLLAELANTQAALRWFGQAHATIDHALNLMPDNIVVVAGKASFYVAEGNLDAAGALLEGLTPGPAHGLVVEKQMIYLLYRRRYAEVVTILQNMLSGEKDPRLRPVLGDYYVLLGLAQQRVGDAAAARATYERGRAALLDLRKAGYDNSARLAAALGLIEAGLGNATAARREAQQVVALNARDAFYNRQEVVARIEVQLGDLDAAMALLPLLLQSPATSQFTQNATTVASLRLDPAWDPIRGDARFQALLRETGGEMDTIPTQPSP